MRESKSRALPLGYNPKYEKKAYSLFLVGWIIGLEPTASRATTWRSNHLSYTHHMVTLWLLFADEINGAPEGTRTPGLLLRRQLLYPAELLAHVVGAGDENRTRIPSLEGWCPDHCATPARTLHGNVS